MLVQVLFSIRSERQLVEQVRYNLLFRWFIGLVIEHRLGPLSLLQEPRPAGLPGQVLMENRSGLVVSAVVTQADGYDERAAALACSTRCRPSTGAWLRKPHDIARRTCRTGASTSASLR